MHEFALDLLERITDVAPAAAEARPEPIDPLTERERTSIPPPCACTSTCDSTPDRKLGANGRRDAVHRARLLH